MGLRAGDLKDLVYDIFEIDSYKSKMGNDADIVVVSFDVKQKEAAKDLVNFIETAHDFVLDADHTPGEVDTGVYKVFVEIDRNRDITKNIIDMVEGLKNLTDQDFRYRYHKAFRSQDVTEDNLSVSVPVDADSYNVAVLENKMNSYKEFFSNSFVDDITLLENKLTIKKVYADPVQFVFKDFGDRETMLENIKEKINVNDYAEILFLTKYVGDYNITKFGERTLTFENKDKILVVERHPQ